MNEFTSFVTYTLERVVSWFGGIAHDKLLHDHLGGLIALVATVIGIAVLWLLPTLTQYALGGLIAIVATVAMIVTTMAAIVKELIDKGGAGTPEYMDILWTMWGGFKVVLPLYMLAFLL